MRRASSSAAVRLAAVLAVVTADTVTLNPSEDGFILAAACTQA
jgi:hypothetical protein